MAEDHCTRLDLQRVLFAAAWGCGSSHYRSHEIMICKYKGVNVHTYGKCMPSLTGAVSQLTARDSVQQADGKVEIWLVVRFVCKNNLLQAASDQILTMSSVNARPGF